MEMVIALVIGRITIGILRWLFNSALSVVYAVIKMIEENNFGIVIALVVLMPFPDSCTIHKIVTRSMFDEWCLLHTKRWIHGEILIFTAVIH